MVLVSIDTLNLLYTDLYGEPTGLTPNLVELAGRGTLLDEAHTPVPITLPSHTSMLSGRLPEESDVMLNGDRVPADLPTLPAELRRSGYRTAAVLGASVLDRRYGLEAGFDHYDDRIAQELPRSYRNADEVTDRALAWLEAHGDEPFFLWVHYFDPHEPYVSADAPPDARLLLDGEPVRRWTLARKEWVAVELELPPGRHRLTWESLRDPHPSDGPDTGLAVTLHHPESLHPFLAPGEEIPEGPVLLREPWDLELEQPGPGAAKLTLELTGRLQAPQPPVIDERYRREVAFVDRHLGRLVERVDELDAALGGDTLWAVVSDHGEGIWRRLGRGHAEHVLEVQLRTLWLLAGPGVPAGRRVTGSPVLLADLAPTLLDLLGLAAPERIPGEGDGRSQVGCWREEGCAARDGWWAYGARREDQRVTAAAGYRWPWKGVWFPDHGLRLFDLSTDGWEQRPLGAEEGAPPAAALRQRLPRRFRSFQRAMDERRQVALGEEDREVLEALGYL